MNTPVFSKAYLREIIFGLEDSFVSTLGAVTGIAAGAGSRNLVILAGLVIITVEALSMAAGSYLSSKAVSDAERQEQVWDPEGDLKHPALAGAVMGLFYLLAGLVPLLPYLLFSLDRAVLVSIVFTLLMLFATGIWQTRYTKRLWWKSGVEMLLVGGAAIALGYAVGRLATQTLGIAAF